MKKGYKDNPRNVLAMKRSKTRGTGLSREELETKMGDDFTKKKLTRKDAFLKKNAEKEVFEIADSNPFVKQLRALEDEFSYYEEYADSDIDEDEDGGEYTYAWHFVIATNDRDDKIVHTVYGSSPKYSTLDYTPKLKIDNDDEEHIELISGDGGKSNKAFNRLLDRFLL